MLNTFDEDLTHKWNFKGYLPDLVVINLGSNDFSTEPHPYKSEFTKAYKQILAQLREHYWRYSHIVHLPCSYASSCIQLL